MGLVYTVKGTNMFDLEEGPVAEHAKLFGDRLYKVETENALSFFATPPVTSSSP